MQIYNSLGRKKEPFVPVRPGKVQMYVCGITAYDYCHIGHARSALVFDVLARHLRHLGLKVLFVRNFTDVDDKIINRAQKEQRDWREVALSRRYGPPGRAARRCGTPRHGLHPPDRRTLRQTGARGRGLCHAFGRRLLPGAGLPRLWQTLRPQSG